jgi:hypothetical protein
MARQKQTANVLTTKTCKEMTDLVRDYLTDALDATIKRDFEQHLRICPDCVSFLNTYRKTVALTKAVESKDIPEAVGTNILTFLRERMRRIGALVIYFIGQLAA